MKFFKHQLLNELIKKFKNVIVTGGCGFIGGYLVRRLIEEGNYNIINIDKLSYASDHSITNEKIMIFKDSRKRYKFIKSDLCNFEELNNIVSEFKPEIIFHLAAESHVDRSIDEPLQTIQSNIIGTFNLLESTRKFLKLLPNSERDILNLFTYLRMKYLDHLIQKGCLMRKLDMILEVHMLQVKHQVTIW